MGLPSVSGVEPSGCRKGAWAELTTEVTSMKGVRNATHVKRKGVIALLVVKTDDTIASFLTF